MSDLPPGLAGVIREAAPLTERFTEAGYRLFFVGGVVRDHLLGRARTENDLDATTDARPPATKELVRDLAEAVWTQGERFGTIGCTVNGQIYEITTHRAEAYDAASRKPVVSFGDRIEDDLARRDFTINAIAVDLVDGTLVDPHHGRDDLAARVLRTPLDPEVSFSEDPLRMLRAARFHAGYGLVPTAELTVAISSLLDRMAIVSAERIRDELQKLLLIDAPARGFRLLADTGLLGRVLPELADLTADDAAERGGLASAVANDAAARWAALLAPSGISAGQLGSLKFSGALTRDIVWFAAAFDWARSPGERTPSSPAVRRLAAMVPNGRELGDLFDWIEAIRRPLGLEGDDVAAFRRAHADLLAMEPDLVDPAALLTGEAVCAILGISPGREVGVAMKWLRDLRIEEGRIEQSAAADRLVKWWSERDHENG